MQKTISIQAGVETPVLGISGIHTDILNLTNGFVYASSKAGVVADADGVIAIPSMARALLLDSGGSAFILGTSEGKVQLQGSDNACVNFSSTPKGGDSPGGSGDNGATFTPVPNLISDNQLELSWVNDKGLTNPDTVTITAPAGATGENARINGENAITLTGYNGITVNNGAGGDVGVTCNFFSTATGYLISATDAQDAVPFNSVKIKPAASLSTGALIVAGRNLLPYPYYESSKVENGLTFTDNEDGSISVEGTSTAETSFLLALRPSTDPVYLPKGDITLSGCPAGGSTFGYSIQADSDADYDGATVEFYEDGAGVTENLSATTPMVNIRIVVPDGTTLPGVTFYPQFEVGASSSPFRKGTVSTYPYSSDSEDEFTVTNLGNQIGPDMNVFTHSESCTATLSINHNTNPQMATLQRQISDLQDTVSSILKRLDAGDAGGDAGGDTGVSYDEFGIPIYHDADGNRVDNLGIVIFVVNGEVTDIHGNTVLFNDDGLRCNSDGSLYVEDIAIDDSDADDMDGEDALNP